MNLFLQHPALLGLLALAAVPVLVHLLARARPPAYHFSNTEFLRKVLRLTSRFRRPKDWLLLALRTLALLALAAAFLGPLLLSDSAPLPGETRGVVCLIDRSASMAAKEGAASRFESASAAATRFLDDARPDTANLIWIDADPDSAFPEPGPNLDFLADELARASVRAEPNRIDAAFDLATRQLADVSGRREIRVFSDFQASEWRDVEPAIPADIDLHLVAAAGETPANLSITSLTPVPAAPVAGRSLDVQCRVTNHSPEPRRTTLVLDAGGSRQSRALDLPASGAAETLFTVRVPAPGLLPITAEIDADAFPADDRRHAVVRVRESLRMAVAAPADTPAASTLARVAGALPWLEAVPGADPANPPPCDLLVIPAWNGDRVAELKSLAGSDTAVVVLPGPLPRETIDALVSDEPAPSEPGAPVALETDNGGWAAAPVSDHPAFSLFADGEFGNPVGGRFRERLRLADAGEVLARFSDGVPALLAHPELPILVSNLSLDPARSTWPTRSAFVPAVAELILHLRPGGAAESFAAEPGTEPAWTDAVADAATRPTLEGPDGGEIPLASSRSERGVTWVAEAPAKPGLYRWLVSGQPVHYTAVNFPASESSLAPLPEPPALTTGATRSRDRARAAALDRGLPLWPWLIAAALLFLLIESILTQKNPGSPAPA